MSDERPTGAEGLDPNEGLDPEPDAALNATPPEAGDASEGSPVAVDASEPESPKPPRQTVAGRVWVGIIVAVILLVLLIIFIAENSHRVTLTFLGTSGTLSLGLMMLIAAVVGALITLLVGTTRILQLRREVQQQNRRA
jgi:uncharacterized integral membrane protein